eukprot:CAMPEP_0197653048 /NCGR_PEP_ID=MMETSP1338-20131121/34817_1 /TAXON_ID=43686 ORGANISM="Pelagodinium beii, Strain RCC1491" /NCGR_SAMPLE_ID=MMETSP1338 /ASSEMBLY_ACC=CAM_ASM_000754 /LENGTH=323 /DNA_ID=CAMNT_0043228047 /DNA_START=42 /DNA_END=1010 /DNA_ORIENTATION=+
MGCGSSQTAAPASHKSSQSRVESSLSRVESHPNLLTATPRLKLQQELNREFQELEQGIVEPTGPHTHTVIMLHGLGNKGSDFVSTRGCKGLPATVADMKVEGTAGIKYIFPTAPLRFMYWEGKDGMPSESRTHAWYTYYSDYSGKDTADNDDINREEYDASVQRLVDLVNSEAATLGDASKVIIGGYSHGGTIAAGAAMAEFEMGLPAALVGINTLPTAFTKPNPSNTAIPVYSFVGANDDVYPMNLQEEAWGRWESAGYALRQHIEVGVQHGPFRQIMHEYAARWIVQAFYAASNGFHATSIDTAFIFEALETACRAPDAWW